MDNITIEPNLNKRDVHPSGPYGAICVDIIDLGMRANLKWNKGEKAVVFVFLTSKGELNREFSVSLGDKANLKKFLESWRGAKFTAEELGAKLTLADFHMKPAMISVEHSPSKSDPSKIIYANLGAIMPLPEGMTAPSGAGYVRPAFWLEKKRRYADEFAAFMSAPPKDKIDESMDPVPF